MWCELHFEHPCDEFAVKFEGHGATGSLIAEVRDKIIEKMVAEGRIDSDNIYHDDDCTYAEDPRFANTAYKIFCTVCD